jgi:hypothetical protein
MFIYHGKEYDSKAHVIREMYDKGEVTLSIVDKKRVASELGISIPTVHATIVKYTGLTPDKKEKKIAPAVTQASNRLNQKVAKARSTDGVIFINDKSEEVREELMKDPNKILVTNSPNQWDLPVVDPPLCIIDPNYDPNWKEPQEELIERSW